MLILPDKTIVAESQLYSSCRFVQLQAPLGRTRTLVASLHLAIVKRGACIQQQIVCCFTSRNFEAYNRNKSKVLPHDSRPTQKYKVHGHETSC